MKRNRSRGGLAAARRRLARIALLSMLLPLLLMTTASAAGGDSPTVPPPNEKILCQVGPWLSEYWGNGVLGYTYLGNAKSDDARKAVEFTVRAPTILTAIADVHVIPDSGVPGRTPGTLTLIDGDGNTYGPYTVQTVPLPSDDAAELWVAEVGSVALQTGTYMVTDSDPETLVCNSRTGGTGATFVKGVDAAAFNAYMDALADGGAAPASGISGTYIIKAQSEETGDLKVPVTVVDMNMTIQVALNARGYSLKIPMTVISRSDDEVSAAYSFKVTDGWFAEATVTFTRNGGKYDVSGNAVISGDQAYSVSFTGDQRSAVIPGYVPTPASGIGKVGSIPGPATTGQAVTGIIVPAVTIMVIGSIAGAFGGFGGGIVNPPGGGYAPGGGYPPGGGTPSGGGNVPGGGVSQTAGAQPSDVQIPNVQNTIGDSGARPGDSGVWNAPQQHGGSGSVNAFGGEAARPGSEAAAGAVKTPSDNVSDGLFGGDDVRAGDTSVGGGVPHNEKDDSGGLFGGITGRQGDSDIVGSVPKKDAGDSGNIFGGNDVRTGDTSVGGGVLHKEKDDAGGLFGGDDGRAGDGDVIGGVPHKEKDAAGRSGQQWILSKTRGQPQDGQRMTFRDPSDGQDKTLVYNASAGAWFNPITGGVFAASVIAETAQTGFETAAEAVARKNEGAAVPAAGPAKALFCTRCGSKLADGAVFCSNCGRRIS